MRRNRCSHCGPKSRHDVHHARRESHLGGNRGDVQRRRLGELRLSEAPEQSGSFPWKLGPGSDNLSRTRPSQPVSGWARVRPIPLFRVACLPQRASEQNGSGPLQQSTILRVSAWICVCVCVCVCLCVCVCVCERERERVCMDLCVSVSVCVLREQGHLVTAPRLRGICKMASWASTYVFKICPINVPNGNMVSLPQSP